MKKRNILIWIIILILIWFGVRATKKTADVVVTEKTDFLIETLTIWNSWESAIITKNWKVEWLSDITLTAQTAWRVVSVNSKIWLDIKKWANIARLEDTQWSTTYRAQNSNLAVDSAENTYEVQKKNIEKQIQDLLLAKQRAELNYTNTNWWESNNTILQIAWLQKSLEKARLDYQTKISGDSTTLQNNIISAKNIYNDTLNLLFDVVDQSDKLLGVTDANRRLASDYDIYLWWRNVDVRRKAEDQLRVLIAKKTELQTLWNNITLNTIDSYLEKYKAIAQGINDFTISMKDVFINSLEDARYLPKSKLDWYTASFWILQSKASWIIASTTTQANALRLFVEAYLPNQESLRKQIEILENDIAVKENQLEEAAKNSEINLKGAQWNYDFVVGTKDLNLQTINNTLKSAQIALNEAQFNISKLSINSPIAGIISDILVDIWQEVTIGTPIAKIVSQWKWIKLSVSEKELEWIEVWKNVTIKNEEINGNWLIVSVWRVADKNGNFPIEVYIENGDFAIWTYVDIEIPASRWTSMIPLNAVSIVDNNIWQIILWDWKELSTKIITLGLVFWQYIEVKETLDPNLALVISDTKNYDKEKMNIKVK